MTETRASKLIPAQSRHASRDDSELASGAASPYELYARWRTSEPVRRGPMGEWYLTRYDDVLVVLGDPARFSSSLVGTDRKSVV